MSSQPQRFASTTVPARQPSRCSRALSAVSSGQLVAALIFVDEVSIARSFQTALGAPEAHPNAVPYARLRHQAWPEGIGRAKWPILNSFTGFG